MSNNKPIFELRYRNEGGYSFWDVYELRYTILTKEFKEVVRVDSFATEEDAVEWIEKQIYKRKSSRYWDINGEIK